MREFSMSMFRSRDDMYSAMRAEIESLTAERDELRAQTEWLKARLAWLQLPSNKHDHDTREKWLIACGMPALKGEA